MTRGMLFVPAAAIVLSCGALAQSAGTPAAPAPALDPAAQAALVRLGGQLMVAGKAYEYDRVLADDIGPRLTGSANYVKAADWATGEFTRLGLSNVHHESWEIGATWEPETWASARILKPHEQRLHMESDGWSPSTPAGGARGNVYYLSAFTPEAIKGDAAKIKDAIVLIDTDSLNAAEPLLWGKLTDSVAQIAGEGARGILLGMGATNNVPSMIGLSCCSGNIAPLPVGNVGQEDTLLLRRMLDRGPVEVEFSFTNRIREHVEIDNVVADIPGPIRTADMCWLADISTLGTWAPAPRTTEPARPRCWRWRKPSRPAVSSRSAHCASCSSAARKRACLDRSAMSARTRRRSASARR